jgi:CubicO group peptidase (beta-lactamase class C family)
MRPTHDKESQTMPELSTSIGGRVAPGFASVESAFRDVLAQSERGGGALCIMIDGEIVTDLWGGYADVSTGAAWTESTTTSFFSMTKGLITLLVARLVDEKKIDLDAPVTLYWPEFGAAGKDAITVRQVMAHRAGLSYPIEDITLEHILAWDPVIHILERQAPLWEPNTAHSYHALTYGWLVGEIIRRVTGLDVSQAFQRYLAEPVGAEAWIGVPPEHLGRIAQLVPEPGFTFALPEGLPNKVEIERAFTLGGGMPDYIAGPGTGLNDPAYQQAIIPAGLGIGTARSLAQLWSAAILATPTTQPVSGATLDDMTSMRSEGEPVWTIPGMGFESWGTGFQIPSEVNPMLGPSSFGHGGAGGQLSFADRDSRLSFGFLTNDLRAVDDFRALNLLTALHADLH